jgi:prophage antirepressor-like protein
MSIISESGVYRLVMRVQTKNPQARAFQDWVTRVVLPSIRKTGGYIAGQEHVGKPGGETDAEFLARALLVAQRAQLGPS